MLVLDTSIHAAARLEPGRIGKVRRRDGPSGEARG